MRYLRQTAIWAVLLVWCGFNATFSQATIQGKHGPSPEIAQEQNPFKIEIARLRIQNTKGGEIQGSIDKGKTWIELGHVEKPTMQVNRKGYNASKYGPVGTVEASAVNALHFKSAQNTADDRGVIWSIAPKVNTAAGELSLQTEVSPNSAVYTDIPGGTGIFGGPFTPFVGNPILLSKNLDETPQPLPPNYVPQVGDVWTVPIMRPLRYPRQITFENRFGGYIWLQFRGEDPKVIGEVLRPVEGIGRFVGSYFADVGRIRANHNGVIDISTSPINKIGGFQIVPANHAMSTETHYIREQTQWMVVGPVSVLDPSWEGVAPLFSDYIRPRYEADGFWKYDAMEGLLGRFRVEVQTQTNKDWQPMPEFGLEPGAALPQWANTCLSNITEIRITFPFSWMVSESDVKKAEAEVADK
ncbi:MAG: hypothetical protein ABI210_14625 [Abditibacteriaceae bacterium]